MRFILWLLLIVVTLITVDGHAQFNNSQQQYLTKENLATNGGFEQGKRGWTLGGTGVFTIDQTKEVIGKSGGCVTLTAQTLDLSQTLSTGYNANLSGLQGIAEAYIYSSSPNVKVCALVDGVEQTCESVKNNSSYDFYQIPIVLSGTSVGISFKTTGNETGLICLDGINFGARKLTQEIAQTEHLGIAYTATAVNCAWTVTSTSWSSFPVDAQCLAAVISGNAIIKAPATVIPAIVLPAGSPAGTYEFQASGEFVGDPAANGDDSLCQYRFYDGVNFSYAGGVGVTNSGTSGENMTGSTMLGTIHYDSVLTVDTTIEIQAKKFNSTVANCYVAASVTRELNITAKYYPPKSTVVAQAQEKDKFNSNKLTAVLNGTTCAIESESIAGWITSTTDTAVGSCKVDYTGLGLTVLPSIGGSLVFTGGYDYPNLSGFSLTAVNLNSSSSAGAATDPLKYTISLTKQGVDFNKSQIIIGKFKDIDTTDLCQVEYINNSGATISQDTEDIEFSTQVKDNCGLWTNAGNTGANTADAFTANKDTQVSLHVTIAQTSSGTQNPIRIYKDNAEHTTCGNTNTSYSRNGASCQFTVVKDSVYTVRVTAANIILSANNLHKITITEIPDTQSIIANLNDTEFFKDNVQTLDTTAGLASKVCSWEATGAGAISYQFGACILSSSDGGTDRTTYNFNTDYWSSTPVCTCTVRLSTGTRGCHLLSKTTTQMIVYSWNTSGTFGDYIQNITCHGEGPK